MKHIRQSSTEYIYEEEYKEYFKNKEEYALERALDTRKFEIDLYWKRATYFWTFIGATFAGFFVAYASTSTYRRDLLVILCCIGMVFSFAWFCVNKGSKYWQENWEKHVDLLEDHKLGPLFKVVLSRNDKMSSIEEVKNIITGPQALSVSKINQLISLFITLLWIAMLIKVLWPINPALPLNVFYMTIVSLSLIICVSFIWQGRTYTGGHYHVGTLRKSRIKPHPDKNCLRKEKLN